MFYWFLLVAKRAERFPDFGDDGIFLLEPLVAAADISLLVASFNTVCWMLVVLLNLFLVLVVCLIGDGTINNGGGSITILIFSGWGICDNVLSGSCSSWSSIINRIDCDDSFASVFHVVHEDILSVIVVVVEGSCDSCAAGIKIHSIEFVVCTWDFFVRSSNVKCHEFNKIRKFFPSSSPFWKITPYNKREVWLLLANLTSNTLYKDNNNDNAVVGLFVSATICQSKYNWNFSSNILIEGVATIGS